MDPDRATVPCPPDDVLGALVDRALERDERARVTAHLDECTACRQIVIAAVRGGVARAHPPTRTPTRHCASRDRH